MVRIELPEEKGRFFTTDELKNYIRNSRRNYIIQGQVNCSKSDHDSPHSLDYWLRDNYAEYPDRKQSTNEVIDALEETGEFKEGRFRCPDRTEKITIRKGIEIVK